MDEVRWWWSVVGGKTLTAVAVCVDNNIKWTYWATGCGAAAATATFSVLRGSDREDREIKEYILQTYLNIALNMYIVSVSRGGATRFCGKG